MKRILVAFGILLLLSSTAVANMVSVRELRIQADALGHWTKTYKPWGRTIDIDVPIIVPDVDSFPVLTIENAIPLTDLMMEDIIRVGEQLQDDCWFYSVENGERKGDQLFIRLTRNTNGIEKDSFLPTDRKGIWIRYDSNRPEFNYIPQNSITPYTTYYGWEIDRNKAYAEDNPLSIAAIEEFICKIINDVYTAYPEEERSFYPVTIKAKGRVRESNNSEDNHAIEPFDNSPVGTVDVTGVQLLHGIPVFSTIDDLLKIPIDSKWQSSTWAYKTRIAGSFLDERFFGLRLNLATVKQIVYPDVPLVPLSMIISEIEKLINAGHIRDVYSVQLCYALYADPDHADFAWCYPTWIIDCIWAENAKDECDDESITQVPNSCSHTQFISLPINGQTGKALLPSHVSQDILFVPEITTWTKQQ